MLNHEVAGAAASTAGSTTVQGQEYLTLKLGPEEYGIEILKVQEIRGYDAVTTIANAPPFIKGVINLRGVIVPIVDLRIKFNLGNPSYDAFTVTVILNVAGRVVGVVVDGVSDVLTLAAEQVKPVPDFATVVGAQFITGLGTVDDRMLILLDIERLLTSPELALVEDVVH